MKKNHVLMFSACAIMLYSCQVANTKMGDFNLLPLPQKVEFTVNSALLVDDILFAFSTDGSELPVLGEYLAGIRTIDDQSRSQIVFKIEDSPNLRSEGYSLEISRKQIFITGKDQAGLLYGFMTLDQIMEDASEQEVPLPQCHIEDFPLLSYRAIHLDVKHHMENAEYYYKLMDKLARYKVNAIIVELEDKIAYESRPLVGSEDALSISEWIDLSDYAMERNIEMSPLIQGLGHVSFILKHEKYKELRDDPKSDWAFNPLDPKTYEVQFDLYREAIKATPHGRYLHVGGDEVHTTGRNSGKSALELQLSWLDKVCKFAEEHGRIPIFWDDMPLKHAGLYRPMFNPKLTTEEVEQIWSENEHNLVEFLDLFPKNCVYMRWNYSSPQAEGNIKAMEWFVEHGFQVMGATAGQTRWVLMPREESNMENIRSFAVTSIEKGLDGLLLTLWDDDSPHFELYMRGILAFAEYCWSGDQRSREEIKSAYRHREFSNTLSGNEYAFVDQLEQAVTWWNSALLQNKRHVFLWKLDDPLGEGVIYLPSHDNKGAWTEKHAKRLERALSVLALCEDVAKKIETSKSMAIRNQYRFEVYEQVNNLVCFSAHALLTLKSYDMAQNDQEEAEALAKIQALSGEFTILKGKFEQVYAKTRILTKPKGYLLDQDHHSHLANQAISFDWQFVGEILFLQKIDATY